MTTLTINKLVGNLSSSYIEIGSRIIAVNNLIQKEKSPALEESDIFKDIAISLNSSSYVEDEIIEEVDKSNLKFNCSTNHLQILESEKTESFVECVIKILDREYCFYTSSSKKEYHSKLNMKLAEELSNIYTRYRYKSKKYDKGNMQNNLLDFIKPYDNSLKELLCDFFKIHIHVLPIIDEENYVIPHNSNTIIRKVDSISSNWPRLIILQNEDGHFIPLVNENNDKWFTKDDEIIIKLEEKKEEYQNSYTKESISKMKLTELQSVAESFDIEVFKLNKKGNLVNKIKNDLMSEILLKI